ncbi:hypothetical protein [Vibrio nomapromontoriensis]|uniref:HEAT repeat domain-containing protein n=1 Tax=Vibrio nomapromontoriensis TaxID=2910246 RepID=UPI003D0D57B2
MQDVEHIKTDEIPAESTALQQSQAVLIELLTTGDDAQKCYSARAVAQGKVAAAESILNQCLYANDPDVVIDCVSALSAMKLGDVTSLIDIAMHHPDGDARLASLDALAPHSTDTRVKQLLEDMALGRQHNDQWGLASDWDDWWDIQIKAVSILVEQTHENSLPFLQQLLQQLLQQDPEPELEALIYNGIARFNPEWIIDQLPHAALMQKRKLVKSLSHSNSQIAKAHLYKHLRDDDATIRKNAINALAEKQANEYFWDIVKCLKDESSLVQQQAIVALKTFHELEQLDRSRLVGYLKDAPANAYSQLLALCVSQPLTIADLDTLIITARHANAEALVALLSHWNNLNFNSSQQQQLLDLLILRIEERTTAVHTQIQLIRQLTLFAGHEHLSLPLLEKFISKENEQLATPYYDSSVRQASFDTLSHSTHPNSEHLIKTILFGTQAYPDAIEINEITETDPGLVTLLEQHEQKLSQPMVNTNSPTSTLGMIQQANVESTLVTPAQQNDDQQKNIIDMVEGMDDTFEQYADIVKANFDSADQLELNRKKIARLPKLANRILLLKALGQSSHPMAAQWLIDSILGSESHEMREIFYSLARLKKLYPKEKQIDNGIGAAGNALYHGDALLKQAAAQFLTTMPTSHALPVLLIGLNDDNEHVRLTCLTSLEPHLARIKQVQRVDVETAINNALSDSSGGVRKQALKLSFMVLKPELSNKESLSPLLELALNDEECHSIANLEFKRFGDDIMALINAQLMQLTHHRQPNAIKLLGELMG